MIYLLDTCTVSDLVKGYPQVLARFRAIPFSSKRQTFVIP